MRDPFAGRSVFLVHTPRAIAQTGITRIADKLHAAHCAALLIRVGRGSNPEPYMTAVMCKDLSAALEARNIDLVGWHVPFCRDTAATTLEVTRVIDWVEQFSLAGLIVDAERTPPPDTPRFQGSAANARAYTIGISKALKQRNVAIAFSSHDQPHLHHALPFAEFLFPGQSAMPQVYNRDDDPAARLALSEADYRPLLAPRFAERFRPTTNVSMSVDIGFKNTATCLLSLKRFLDCVASQSYLGHSLWSWEDMPVEAWDYLATRPMP